MEAEFYQLTANPLQSLQQTLFLNAEHYTPPHGDIQNYPFPSEIPVDTTSLGDISRLLNFYETERFVMANNFNLEYHQQLAHKFSYDLMLAQRKNEKLQKEVDK